MGLIIEPHWFFVSSAGFFVLTALLLNNLRRFSPKTWWIVPVALIIFLGWQTRNYNTLWKDQKTYCRYWLSLSPKNHGPNFWLAHAYLQDQDYAQARIYFNRAFVNGFIDWQVYANLGLIENALGNREEAVAYFQKALEVNPSSGVVYNNLGTIAVDQGRVDRAVMFFMKAVDLNPYLMEPRLNLADIYATQGKTAEAISLIEKNLAINSADRRGRRLLLELYLASEEKQKALQLAREVGERSRDIPELLAFGGILAQRGSVSAAKAFYFKVMDVDARNPNAYLEAGKLFGNTGELSTAISLWEDGLKLNPDDVRFQPLIDEARRLQKEPGS
jgi:tetratricopeptide (TPR) repeat protein